jgi:hypothetical protein
MAVSFRFRVSCWQTRFSRIRKETAALTSYDVRDINIWTGVPCTWSGFMVLTKCRYLQQQAQFLTMQGNL